MLQKNIVGGPLHVCPFDLSYTHRTQTTYHRSFITLKFKTENALPERHTDIAERDVRAIYFCNIFPMTKRKKKERTVKRAKGTMHPTISKLTSNYAHRS